MHSNCFESDPSVTLGKKRKTDSKYCKEIVKMTPEGECIYRKTIDCMSRMVLEKEDFRRFSVIWEFRVTGNWVAARVASKF